MSDLLTRPQTDGVQPAFMSIRITKSITNNTEHSSRKLCPIPPPSERSLILPLSRRYYPSDHLISTPSKTVMSTPSICPNAVTHLQHTGLFHCLTKNHWPPTFYTSSESGVVKIWVDRSGNVKTCKSYTALKDRLCRNLSDGLGFLAVVNVYVGSKSQVVRAPNCQQLEAILHQRLYTALIR